MARLIVYHEDDFPPDLECQAVSFVRVVWPFVFSGGSRWERHLWRGSWNAVHFCIVENGVLISYAAVIETRVDHRGEGYRTCGLSSVFTYPPFRGEGHGRQVVDAATRHIRSGGADIAILWCERSLHNFYKEHGWVAVEGAPALIGAKDNPTIYDDPDHPMMLFVSEKGEAGRWAFESEPWYVGHTW